MPAPNLGLQQMMGLGAGADFLRNVIAQEEARKIAARVEAEKRAQLEFENQIKSRAAGVNERNVAVEEGQFGLQQAAANAPKPRTIQFARGLAGDQGKKVARGIYTDTGETAYEMPDYEEPQKPANQNTTDYGDFLRRYAGSIGKTFDQLTRSDEIQARKEWGQSDDRPFSDYFMATPQGVVGINRSGGNPTASLVPMEGTGAPVMRPMPAGMSDTLITLNTMSDLINEALQKGDETGWRGIGGLGKGSIAQFGMTQLGIGDPRDQSLRDVIGNIRATTAKERGGTTFTANEQRLLDTYTSGINEAGVSAKQKLLDFKNFIETKKGRVQGQYGAQGVGAVGTQSGGDDADVKAFLASKPDGRYTLENGVWLKQGGSITRVK